MAKKKRNSTKQFWNRRLYDWRVRHEGWFTLFSWVLMMFSGIIILNSLYVLVSLDFYDINLLLPIALNALFFIMSLFVSLFSDQLESFKALFADVSYMLMYLNGIGLPAHFFFGIPKKGGRGAPALLTMMDKPIWLPILLYVIFFCIGGLIYCWAKRGKVKEK